MSRIPLALALLLVLATVSPAAPPPSYDDAALRAVQFVDAREGWAVGDDGVIWHSIDGGQSWERQKSGTRATLTGVRFLSPYTGYVVGRTERPGGTGSNGVVLTTGDGGITWTELASGVLPGLNAVAFFDEKNGLVCGDACGAYPGGAFTTADGGASWQPVVGPLGGSWLALDGKSAKESTLVGAWGKSASIRDGELVPTGLNAPGGRSVRALKILGKTAIAAADGGLVLVHRDFPNGSWVPVEIPLGAARGACDFHAIASVGNSVWIVGRPGSIVLHSPDAGTSWTVLKTDSRVPLHAIHMLDAKTGWAVGDLGTVLRTTDGGTTWKHCRGKLHAALLGAHASPRSVPLAMVSALGLAEGYLAATVSVTGADVSADPHHAADPFRLASAIRLAGGAASESLWAFPLPGHCDGLTAEQLRAYWDGLHGGQAADQLVRLMTLAIRMWRPDVIVTDSAMPDAPAADQLIFATTKEAFRRAADPTAYPEQIETLGLKAHAAKKLYARSDAGTVAPPNDFDSRLADTPDGAASASLRILNLPSRSFRPFALVAHRLDAPDAKAGFMDGTALAHGGMARRDDATRAWAFTEEYLKRRRNETANRDLVRIKIAKGLDRNGQPQFPKLLESMGNLSAEDAADALAGEADRVPRPMARELLSRAVEQYPTQPATLPAYRWLARYHASAESLRRIELGQLTSLRPNEFYELPQGEIQRVGGAGRTVAKFRTSEAMRDWYSTGPALEAKLFAVNPLASRDPEQELVLHAARLKLGLTADAEKSLANYYRAVVGRRATPGANPWFDALAAELHLLNPKLMPANPKPTVDCAKVADRPVLDGKLDDDAWNGTTEFALKAGSRDWQSSHATMARLACDDEYLYLGVTCRHPSGEQVPAAETRKHDDDVAPHDRVELMLDLDRDYSTYFRLRIDHRGCTADDCWGDASWNPKWFVAVNPSATGWTAEVAIPLTELTGRRPTDRSAWAFNLTRVLPGRGALAWNGPADGTPRPEAMGLLEFRAK